MTCQEQDSLNTPKKNESGVDSPNLSAKLTIWNAYRDVYMKYVTMWFTASTLAFIVFSFCMKTVIVDKTPFVTKVVVTMVMLVFAVLAIYMVETIRDRVNKFADHIVLVEDLLRSERGLEAYFNPLPGSPMMKRLIKVSTVGVWIALVICAVVAVLLFVDSSIFPLSGDEIP